MRESAIEARLVRRVQERGGLCYKFVSPGNRGVPDRLVIAPDGRVFFVELKSKTGRMSELQKFQKSELKARNVTVHVLNSVAAVQEFVEESCKQKSSPKKKKINTNFYCDEKGVTKQAGEDCLTSRNKIIGDIYV